MGNLEGMQDFVTDAINDYKERLKDVIRFADKGLCHDEILDIIDETE